MKGPCSIAGCHRLEHSTGLCGTHYQRKRTTGTTDLETRAMWLDRVADTSSDQCVLWPFSTAKCAKYGLFTVNYVTMSAHSYVCKKFNGPPPTPWHQVAHSCGCGFCINKNHLRWATPKENCADKIMHGTHREGERNSHAKLTNQQAAIIRADTRPQRKIAGDYGVDQKVIQLIKSGQAYKAALGM